MDERCRRREPPDRWPSAAQNPPPAPDALAEWVLSDSPSGLCPVAVLNAVAVALIARGLHVSLHLSEPPSLHVGDEVIQACMVDDRCVLVTQAGEIWGFSGDAGIVDDIATCLSTSHDSVAPPRDGPADSLFGTPRPGGPRWGGGVCSASSVHAG